MKVKNCYCFVDTNTFLHYRFFMEIDWCREIGADHVILVVCSTVLSELDDKKLTGADSKIRDRAKKVISKLAEIADVNRRIQIRPIRPNVELQFLPKEPNIDWESEGLDPRVRDDRIIAKILCERASKNNIVLVAADFGLKLKAESKGIRCHILSENLLMKPKRSPEHRELFKLQEELARLKNRLPILNIKVRSRDGVSNIGRFCLKRIPPLSTSDIDAQINEIRKKLEHSPPATKKTNSPISFLSGQPWLVSENEVKRYKVDLQKYIQQMRSYLKSEWEYNELYSRIIEIRFVVLNEGNSPAEDIDVFLYFPNGFVVTDEDHLPNKPTPPDKPILPRTLMETIADMNRQLVPSVPKFPSAIVTPELPSESGKHPQIRKINSFEVSFSVPKLKHGLQVEFEPVYVIFPSIESAKSFNISYSILAGNHPERVEDQIHIVLNTKGLDLQKANSRNQLDS